MQADRRGRCSWLPSGKRSSHGVSTQTGFGGTVIPRGKNSETAGFTNGESLEIQGLRGESVLMSETVEIDVITEDERNDEWVLYLVEVGPWPQDAAAWQERLRALQDRVLSASDAAIDGSLAKKHPESAGKRVRVQIDTPEGTPEQVEKLVEAIKRYLVETPEYSDAIRRTRHIGGIRVVTGKELGRFGGA